MNEESLNKALAAKRAYQRQWRAKNKDKVRAANERYWLKVAERMNQEGGNDNATDENH